MSDDYGYICRKSTGCDRVPAVTPAYAVIPPCVDSMGHRYRPHGPTTCCERCGHRTTYPKDTP